MRRILLHAKLSEANGGVFKKARDMGPGGQKGVVVLGGSGKEGRSWWRLAAAPLPDPCSSCGRGAGETFDALLFFITGEA